MLLHVQLVDLGQEQKLLQVVLQPELYTELQLTLGMVQFVILIFVLQFALYSTVLSGMFQNGTCQCLKIIFSRFVR